MDSDIVELLGLTRVDGEQEHPAWRFTVAPASANPMGTMYGGAPLAAAVCIAEESVGAPVRWATTRFLRPASIGDEITCAAVVEVAGRSTSHVTVRGWGTDGVLVSETAVVAGHGRAGGASGQWEAMPDVGTSPTDGAATPSAPVPGHGAVGAIERRPVLTATATPLTLPPGRAATWMRVPQLASGSRPMLAWVADCVPPTLASLAGGMPGGSLDNTIRYAAAADAIDRDAWILVDIHSEGAADGYGYCSAHLWSEDGRLLGTASQTSIIRSRPAG